MPQLGPLEIAVVLLIALLVFGPNRLPELAQQVGGALRELRKIQNNIRARPHEMMSDETTSPTAPRRRRRSRPSPTPSRRFRVRRARRTSRGRRSGPVAAPAATASATARGRLTRAPS